MPKELQVEQDNEPQHQEGRAMIAVQAYMRHLQEIRKEQTEHRSERKRTGDMER